MSSLMVRNLVAGIVYGIYAFCHSAPAQAYVVDYRKMLVIHDFTASEPGVPAAGLIFDTGGNLYGTESGGDGAVVQWSPPPAGSPAKGWKRKVLHSFAGGSDGKSPYGPLLMDGAGNLYGTTRFGGGACADSGGCGVVFELSPPAKGRKDWTETIPYRFGGDTDGAYPTGGLVADGAGNLYGIATTTISGGASSVFALSPPPAGQTAWGFQVIYAPSIGTARIAGTLVIDPSGNLYGMTSATAFRLAPPTGGQTIWTETDLASLGTYYTRTGLTLGQNGVLYGAYYGSKGRGFSPGGIFALTPSADGTEWDLTFLAALDSRSRSGNRPFANPVLDAAGNLYGTAYQGGHGYGTVFKLSTDGTLSVLHNFDNGRDGANPIGAVVLDAAGNIYGTSYSGPTGQGAVWKLSPD